jgi:hypothetical protein
MPSGHWLFKFIQSNVNWKKSTWGYLEKLLKIVYEE